MFRAAQAAIASNVERKDKCILISGSPDLARFVTGCDVHRRNVSLQRCKSRLRRDASILVTSTDGRRHRKYRARVRARKIND